MAHKGLAVCHCSVMNDADGLLCAFADERPHFRPSRAGLGDVDRAASQKHQKVPGVPVPSPAAHGRKSVACRTWPVRRQ